MSRLSRILRTINSERFREQGTSAFDSINTNLAVGGNTNTPYVPYSSPINEFSYTKISPKLESGITTLSNMGLIFLHGNYNSQYIFKNIPKYNGSIRYFRQLDSDDRVQEIFIILGINELIQQSEIISPSRTLSFKLRIKSLGNSIISGKQVSQNYIDYIRTEIRFFCELVSNNVQVS